METIPYNQFKQYLAEGDVSKLTIGPQKISGTLKGKAKKPGKPFTTVRVNDPGLVKDLDEHKDSGGWDGLRMGVKSETVDLDYPCCEELHNLYDGINGWKSSPLLSLSGHSTG